MKILKFKKLKNNLYEVLLDGKTISLYEDIILKYELLMRKEISSKDLEQIEQEQHLYECYEKSLQYLNKKMRTKKEMQNYLKKCGYSMKDIDYTISKLEGLGYLSEEKYIEAFLHDHVKFTLDGPNKLKKKLKDLGLEEQKIEEQIARIPTCVWQEKIEKIIEKKVNSNHKDSEKNLKLKLHNYLISNGYSYEDFHSKIENISIENENILYEKEKEKLRKRLSRKYTGDELDTQIKIKLYQKGFEKK